MKNTKLITILRPIHRNDRFDGTLICEREMICSFNMITVKTDTMICEDVFMASNAPDVIPALADMKQLLTGYSLSVGDAIQINNDTWVCRDVGFQLI